MGYVTTKYGTLSIVPNNWLQKRCSYIMEEISQCSAFGWVTRKDRGELSWKLNQRINLIQQYRYIFLLTSLKTRANKVIETLVRFYGAKSEEQIFSFGDQELIEIYNEFKTKILERVC